MKKLTLVLSASLALFCVKSQAHPYASGVSLNNGTVTFHLNESVTNGQVYVLFDSGSVSNVPAGIPNNGSNVPRGVYSFSLGAHTNYSINIFNVGTGTAYQTSPNPGSGSATNWDFFSPRGVGVNRNPKSPYFGTIYICEASNGGDTTRPNLQQGLYAMYADGTDRFGYGRFSKPATNATPTTNTVTWGSSTTFAPYRVFVGPDDMLYVCDGSGAGAVVGGGVWMISPDLTNVWPLFPYNGTVGAEGVYVSAQAVVARGSYFNGTLDLFTCEWDRSPYQNVWWYQFYDQTQTPLPLPYDLNNNPQPNQFASDGGCPDIYNLGQNNPNFTVNAGISSFNGVTDDFYMGPDGRFYCTESRNSSAQQNFWMYDAATNGACLLYDDLDSTPGATGPATFWGAEGVAVSDDNQFLAVGTTLTPNNYGGTAGKILYTTFSGPNHMPVLPPSVITYDPAVASTVRGVAFDSADNVYGVSGSEDSLRAFTLGLTTLTIYSNDTTGTNGSFQLVQPGSQVSVTATTPVASQNHGSPIPGIFTLTRTGSASSLSQPLTVNFTLTGTATQAPWTSPAAFTTTSSTSATFGANQTTTTVEIDPVNDNVARPTLTVTLNLQGSQIYSIVPPTAATVSIVNTGPQTLAVSAGPSPTMYRGLAKDYATAIVTRWGDTNVAQYTVPAANFTYGGTAQANVDFTALVQPYNINGATAGSQDLTFNPGDVSVPVMVGNPTAATSYVGDKTILLGVNSGSGYTGATNKATLTILDNHYQNENVVWSNALTSASDSTNWTVAFGGETNYTVVFPNYQNTPPGSQGDFDVEFGYNLATDSISPPPNGSATALKVTVNKNATTGANCGVSVYPQIPPLSGDYAVRFSMNLVRGTGTEYGQFGINHYGTNEQWWSGAGIVAGGVGNTNIDGVWYSISSDQGGAAPNSAVGDFMAMVGQKLPNAGWLTALPPQSEASYTNAFKHPVPYSASGGAGYGSPATQAAGDTTAWTDVEIKQSNNIVTLSFNRTPIFVYTNRVGGNAGGGVYTNGVPMLGYSDPFRSIGSGGASYYSSIRAVSLSTAAVAPRITNTQIVGSNVVITFTTTSGTDTTANFFLQSEPALQTSGNTWADVSPAANITGGSGTFQATVPVNGSAQFYRIRHN